MARKILISFLENDYAEMLSVIESERSSRHEKTWAKQHEQLLSPIMEKLGWDGNTITE